MIIRKQDLIANRWSGGTTTELFIFPPEADYLKRDFDVRISTATVETERSEFSDLTGYHRLLIVLAGELTMEHQIALDTKSTHLLPLQPAFFLGEWKTIGYGKVTDFNVIYKPKYHVSAEIIHFHEHEELVLTSAEATFFIWTTEGELITDSGNCKAEELYVLEANTSQTIRATVNSTIILVKINSSVLK
jgi:environmental stress-induced protein Ves